MELEDFAPTKHRSRVRVWEHGTEAAIARHKRAVEPLCDECEEARSSIWEEKNARAKLRGRR